MNNKLPLSHKLFIPSIFDIILITVFATTIIVFPLIKSYDIWWHLRTGDLILNRIFPFTDIYSFTAFGKPWILHEWGSEVIFAFVYKNMGIAGLIMLRSLLFALTLALVFKIMLCRNINILIAFVFTLIITIGTANTFNVRPHLFTNLFLVILFWIYIEFRHNNKQKLLRFLPLLFVLWINLHGGFIIGFIFLGTCILAELLNIFIKFNNEQILSSSECKALILYTLLSFAACFINPNTYKGVLYPLLYMGDQMPNNFITEWAPSTIWNNVALGPVIFLAVVGLALNKKKLCLYEIFLILVFTFFAFSAVRHISIFALIAVPIITPLWQHIILVFFNQFKEISHGKLNLVLQKVSAYFINRSSFFLYMEKHLNYHLLVFLIVIGFIIIYETAGEQLNVGLKKTSYPREAVDYIKDNNIKGNIFNQYAWGGFLIWRFPDKKVFIDGRMDVYKKEISEPYVTVINMKEGWEDVLEQYSIKHILVKKDKIISKFLTKISDKWILVNESDNACFFSKKINDY